MKTQFNPAFFGMCSNQAMSLALEEAKVNGPANTEEFIKHYKGRIKQLYVANIEIMDELIREYHLK